jgi:hypothetical protein
VKPDQVIRQQPVEDQRRACRDPEYFRRRKRDVPEMRARNVRTARANARGCEGKMIILKPYGGRLIVRGRQHGIRKSLVDRLVARVMPGAYSGESGPQMTQRPQDLIGITEIIFFDVALIEPHTMKCIARILGRHPDTAVCIADFGIRIAAAPCHPVARDGLHHGVQCRGQSTRRPAYDHVPRLLFARVLVRLTVADNNEAPAGKQTLEFRG